MDHLTRIDSMSELILCNPLNDAGKFMRSGDISKENAFVCAGTMAYVWAHTSCGDVCKAAIFPLNTAISDCGTLCASVAFVCGNTEKKPKKNFAHT
jgi:hypothetical protein